MSSTVEIKAADVQKLRQMTGTGLMDCKRALSDSSGDMEKAVSLLRERGIAKSSKRSDRLAGEGAVLHWISEDEKKGILLEWNCETDFVARNEEFLGLGNTILKQIQDNLSWTSADQIPAEAIKSLSGKLGEKMEAKRFARFETGNGIVTKYIHMGAKLGVLLQLEGDKDVKGNAAAAELAREISLQIAGAGPSYVKRDEVPSDIVEEEKEITKKQMEGQKKPPEILEKIATGKLTQFYSIHCLLDQPRVRDSSGKTKIQDVIDQASKKEGIQFSVAKFARFRVGAD